jgi:hypothetical protein
LSYLKIKDTGGEGSFWPVRKEGIHLTREVAVDTARIQARKMDLKVEE